MKFKGLLLTLCLAAGGAASAPEPQTTPLQCVLPEQGGTAKAAKDGSFNLEKCLIKAGNKNFSRKGKVLTVFLAGGQKKQFKDNPSDGDAYAAYSYDGYDPKTGLHFVSSGGYEWSGDLLIDHESGAELGSGDQHTLTGGISPDRQWQLADSGDLSGFGSLYMNKLPLRGQKGAQAEVKLPGNLSEFRESGGEPLRAQWSGPASVQVDWQCGDEENKKLDRTLLTLQGAEWTLDHVPCTGKASVSNQVRAAAQQTTVRLQVGLTLDEVEKLFGRTADGYKINPLAFLGKKEVTRVWKVNGGQLEVTFVGDVVSSWR